MKWLYYIAFILHSLIVIASCTKDNYLQYDTSKASLRFVYSSTGNDSIIYSFGLHPRTEKDVVEIPLRLIGLSAPKEREIGVEVIAEKTTAKENIDFVVTPSTLPKDSIVGSLKIELKKDTSLAEGKKVITLRLCANESFAEAPVNESTFRIVVTNELIKPNGWIFNEYSRVKHEFVILHTGVATNYNLWSTSEQIYWKGILINALYEYNKEHPGEPLTDENGLVVIF